MWTPIAGGFLALFSDDSMLAQGPTISGFKERAGRWLRMLRRGLLLLVLALVLLGIGRGDYRPSALDTAVAPYRYSILAWELEHLSHKWTNRIGELWPYREELSREEEVALVRNFFAWGTQQRADQAALRRAQTPGEGDDGNAPERQQRMVSLMSDSLERNEQRRQEFLPVVEGIVEEELTGALEQQGFGASWLGVFPPVDVVFGRPPNAMVLSPRDRISREDVFLLQAGLSDGVKEGLEAVALETGDLSAVVVRTGGLSVYPSVVMDTAGLRNALEVAAHEWVHHWLFFRPLGRNYRQSPEMLTLNETAATIAGEELGDMVYTALTGEEVTRPWVRSTAGGIDFAAELRETRRRAEELLAQGDIEGAESYMEERRRFLVSRGYNIRKLNQAYFAFHGSYATGAGSVSPIGGQLEELRRQSSSLKEFLDTMARFGSYGEFVRYWEARQEAAAETGQGQGRAAGPVPAALLQFTATRQGRDRRNTLFLPVHSIAGVFHSYPSSSSS